MRTAPFRRRFGVAGSLVALTAAIAACGGDDSSSTETAASSAGSASSESTGSSDSTATSVIRFGHNRAPTTGFDPHRATLPHDDIYLGLVYEPLIREDRDASLVPGLATQWSFVDDGAALELSLRDDVTFQDGAAFDADAVKANLDRARTLEGTALGGEVEVIEEVEVVDPTSVRLHLSGPAASLPRSLSSRLGMMISPDALDADDLDANPVGAGMFRLVEYQEGVHAVYERFEDYWDPDDVGVDRFEIVMMADPAARLNALRSGQIEIGAIDPSQAANAESSGLATVVSEGMNRQMVQFNRTRAAFDDPLVRQALNYAVDREGIAGAVYDGFAVPSAQLNGEMHPFAHVDGLDDLYPYDPDRARELLAEAGWGDGFEFELLVSADPFRQRIAQILQAQYAEVGVTVNVRSMDVTALGETFYVQLEGDAIIAEILGAVEPTQLTRSMFLAGEYTNPGGHEIDRVTDAHWAASASVSDEERQEAVHDLVTAVAEEAAVVMLVHPKAVYGVAAHVQGFEPAVPGFPSFRGVTAS